MFSKNVQVVAGPDCRILDIVTPWPGSTHDQHIFDHSRICFRFQDVENQEFGNGILLGDSGYECRPYLLTPLTNPANREEQLYNESLIRTRQTVERLFGIWKRRFPILHKGMYILLNYSILKSMVPIIYLQSCPKYFIARCLQ